MDNKRIFHTNYPYRFMKFDNDISFVNKKLLTCISGDKSSKVQGELYSERRRVIEFFEKNTEEVRNKFDLYGFGWQNRGYVVYKGTVDSKFETYKHYKFALCLEKSGHLNGYITEKLFDCLVAKIVPIYKGTTNIDELVPKECYIAYDDFGDVQSLYEYLDKLSEIEWQKFIDAGQDFLNSEAKDRFTDTKFVQNVVASLSRRKVIQYSIKDSWLIRLKVAIYDLNKKRKLFKKTIKSLWRVRGYSMKKVALITGITGQDGSYLAELLLSKGYDVHGMKRRASSFNTQRIDHLYQSNHEPNRNFTLHYGDLTDSSNLIRLVQEIQPDEIYNLAAQSHVKVSFDTPEFTANVDGLGTLRLLEAVRILGLEKKTKLYQASTSELFGLVQETPQRETTPFYPRSPYACAKIYAYWITVNYREAYGIFAANGILFNHESPRRGETFVTRKITRAAARIKLGIEDKLYLGNLSSRRDWGHAADYVEGMWRVLQQDTPEDFVLATGVTTTIRDFCMMAFAQLGIELEFVGTGVDERGVDKATGKVLIEVDPRYFRPTEVDLLLGDASKAREKLGWTPRYNLEMLVEEMVAEDLKEATKELLLKNNGYEVLVPQECKHD